MSGPADSGLWVDIEHGHAGYGPRLLPLGRHEVAVLAALVAADGRVLSRQELARRAGLSRHSPRRTDSVLVLIRQALGAEALRCVRGRGWQLVPASTPPAGASIAAP